MNDLNSNILIAGIAAFVLSVFCLLKRCCQSINDEKERDENAGVYHGYSHEAETTSSPPVTMHLLSELHDIGNLSPPATCRNKRNQPNRYPKHIYKKTRFEINLSPQETTPQYAVNEIKLPTLFFPEIPETVLLDRLMPNVSSPRSTRQSLDMALPPIPFMGLQTITTNLRRLRPFEMKGLFSRSVDNIATLMQKEHFDFGVDQCKRFWDVELHNERIYFHDLHQLRRESSSLSFKQLERVRKNCRRYIIPWRMLDPLQPYMPNEEVLI